MSKFFVGQYVKYKEKDGEFIVTKELSNGNYNLTTKSNNGTAVEVFEDVLYAALEPIVVKTLYYPSYSAGSKIRIKNFKETFILDWFNPSNGKWIVHPENKPMEQHEFDESHFMPPIILNLPADPVNHPPHYMSSLIKCGNCDEIIECIDITRHFNFNLGNTIKYIWRADHKGKQLEDLKKARWYLDDLIEQLENHTDD